MYMVSLHVPVTPSDLAAPTCARMPRPISVPLVPAMMSPPEWVMATPKLWPAVSLPVVSTKMPSVPAVMPPLFVTVAAPVEPLCETQMPRAPASMAPLLVTVTGAGKLEVVFPPASMIAMPIVSVWIVAPLVTVTAPAPPVAAGALVPRSPTRMP